MDRLTTRIGIGLAHDAIRAVAVRHGRIVWAAEAPFEAGADVGTTITSLLRAAPVRRFPRPVLSAAIGPHASQIKALVGLPPMQDDATLAALVRENAGSFFLKNGVPLLTTCLRSTDESAGWASAMDEPCVQAVRTVASVLGWRLGYITPTPIAVMRSLEDPTFTWTDGAIAVEVTRTENTLGAVRTRAVGPAEPPSTPMHPVPMLALLGEGAARHADAFGAALLDECPPLSLDPSQRGFQSSKEFGKRLRLPAALIAISATALALSPVAAMWAERRALARVALVDAKQRQVILATLARLDRVSGMLEGVHRFTGSRVLVTPTLGELAQHLPDGAIVVRLELTDDHGSLVVLGAEPAAVRAAVERLPGARSVELIGPVKRESIAGRDVQRMTLAWQRGPR